MTASVSVACFADSLEFFNTPRECGIGFGCEAAKQIVPRLLNRVFRVPKESRQKNRNDNETSIVMTIEKFSGRNNFVKLLRCLL